MTYTKDNIKGLEFKVKGEKLDITYKIKAVDNKLMTFTWHGFVTRCNLKAALTHLNNGTWIVNTKKEA